MTATAMRERRNGYVNDTIASAYRRELLPVLASARAWLTLLVIATLVGLGGPFGTYASLALPERLAYWWAVAATAFVVAAAANVSTARWLQRRGLARRAALAAADAVATIPITAMVVAVGAVFGLTPDVADILLLFGYVCAVTLAVGITTQLVARAPAPLRVPTDPSAPLVPPIVARLHGANRGPLLRISAQDHYVQVVTCQGAELLLMRLQDAVAEAAPEPGAQVHRSHWVATKAVADTERAKGRLFLKLTDGGRVPVGRRYLSVAKAQGLIAGR